MLFFAEILIGGFIALATLYLFHFGKEDVLKGFSAIALVVAALIYVGFAAVGLWTNSANLNWLLLEILGVGIYFLFAILGVKQSVWFLVIGWAAHVFWDVALHSGENAAFVPKFYPPFCIGFDLIFAAYIFWRWRFRLLDSKK